MKISCRASAESRLACTQHGSSRFIPAIPTRKGLATVPLQSADLGVGSALARRLRLDSAQIQICACNLFVLRVVPFLFRLNRTYNINKIVRVTVCKALNCSSSGFEIKRSLCVRFITCVFVVASSVLPES